MIKVRQAQNLSPFYTLSEVEERILVLWNGPGWNWMKEKKSTQSTQGQNTGMEAMEVTQTQPNHQNVSQSDSLPFAFSLKRPEFSAC